MFRLIIIISLLLSACSFGQKSSLGHDYHVERMKDFQVSVTSNGKKVENTEEHLVHYILVSKESLNCFLRSVDSYKKIPFDFIEEHEEDGPVSGLRLKSFDSSKCKTDLGLQVEDLITAVGTKLPSEKDDFSFLFDQLITENAASLTLRRDIKDHKNIYYIEK